MQTSVQPASVRSVLMPAWSYRRKCPTSSSHGPNQCYPLGNCGRVVLDVLEYLEGAHQVERLSGERVRGHVAHLVRANPRGGHRARLAVGLNAEVRVALG